jgi:multimeric flavodoxin WrbA
MELDQFTNILRARDQIMEARRKAGCDEVIYAGKSRKIIGLSCGRKNGNSEILLKEAAMGAEEFGIETEIIRAMELRVKPCNGCDACLVALSKGKIASCPIKDDDVEWILQKTVVEDCGLIVSFPVYYSRPNGYLMSINERMHATMYKHLEVLDKKNRVGGIISVGGSGPARTPLSLIQANMWVQHHHTVVDQIQVYFVGQAGAALEKKETMARAKELGRNVARAMIKPWEEVKYVGEETPISCPVCHCNILQVLDDSTSVVCPSCWVHGKISIENGKMKVKWDEWETTHSQWSLYGLYHHMDDLCQRRTAPSESKVKEMKELRKRYSDYGKIIRPDS